VSFGETFVVSFLGGLGTIAVQRTIRWFLLQVRGEFHCPTCGLVSPLPKDGDE
jgi:hypothetical protein